MHVESTSVDSTTVGSCWIIWVVALKDGREDLYLVTIFLNWHLLFWETLWKQHWVKSWLTIRPRGDWWHFAFWWMEKPVPLLSTILMNLDMIINLKMNLWDQHFYFLISLLIVCLFIQRMQNARMQNAHLFAECAYCRMHNEFNRMCMWWGMSLMDTFFIYFLFRRELFVFVSFVWIRWENNGALVWGAWGW